MMSPICKGSMLLTVVLIFSANAWLKTPIKDSRQVKLFRVLSCWNAQAPWVLAHLHAKKMLVFMFRNQFFRERSIQNIMKKSLICSTLKVLLPILVFDWWWTSIRRMRRIKRANVQAVDMKWYYNCIYLIKSIFEFGRGGGCYWLWSLHWLFFL